MSHNNNSSSSSSNNGGSKKPPAPEFLLSSIKKGDVQGSYDPVSVLKSEIKGNVQIHHKMISPASPTGDFRISLDKAMMYSNLIYSEYAKDDGSLGVGLKTFLTLHGNYEIKDAHGNPTLSQEGHDLKRDVEHFESLYADSVDAEPSIKKVVLAPLKFGPDLKQRLDRPLMDGFMSSVIKRQTIDDANAEDYGEPDMSKGETMPFDLWIGTPKQLDKRNLMIGSTGQQLFTKIYDHRRGITDTPLSRWSDVKEFIYVKGESKATGRRTFRMKAITKALAPSMFANSEKQKGRLQFKLSEIHILAIDYSTSTFVLPELQKNSIMDEMLRSRNSFVILTEKPVEEPVYDMDEDLGGGDGGGGGGGQNQQQQQQQNNGPSTTATGGNGNNNNQQQTGGKKGRDNFDDERRNSPPRQQKKGRGNFVASAVGGGDDDEDEDEFQKSSLRQQQQQKQPLQGGSGRRGRDNTDNDQRQQSPAHHRHEKKAKRPHKQPHVRFDEDSNSYVRVDANGDEHPFDGDMQGGGASDDDDS